MGPVALFADLDRTLIYSHRAVELGTGAGDIAGLVEVETISAHASSFITSTAAAGLEHLTGAGALVPVTSRTIEQYRRVHLPGPAPAIALVALGGRLLRGGVTDDDFSALVASTMLTATAPIEDVTSLVASVVAALVAGHDQVTAVRQVEDLFLVILLQDGARPPEWLEELAGLTRAQGWTCSREGRRILVVPSGLSKGSSARLLADELGVATMLAAGDATSDASLVASADRAMVPAHGDLAATDLPGNVLVSRNAGVLAGEEIVTWASALVGG